MVRTGTGTFSTSAAKRAQAWETAATASTECATHRITRAMSSSSQPLSMATVRTRRRARRRAPAAHRGRAEPAGQQRIRPFPVEVTGHAEGEPRVEVLREQRPAPEPRPAPAPPRGGQQQVGVAQLPGGHGGDARADNVLAAELRPERPQPVVLQRLLDAQQSRARRDVLGPVAIRLAQQQVHRVPARPQAARHHQRAPLGPADAQVLGQDRYSRHAGCMINPGARPPCRGRNLWNNPRS